MLGGTEMHTRPCLLRCASAHHNTPKRVLRSVIFSTPKSGKIMYSLIQNAHLHHTWMSWEVLFVAEQAFLKDKAWRELLSVSGRIRNYKKVWLTHCYVTSILKMGRSLSIGDWCILFCCILDKWVRPQIQTLFTLWPKVRFEWWCTINARVVCLCKLFQHSAHKLQENQTRHQQDFTWQCC